MKVFTVNLDEKDLAALKMEAQKQFDTDGKAWPVGRLVRFIIHAWLTDLDSYKKSIKGKQKVAK